ncbi:MAG: hypothetical protein HYY84_07520 [Deltaproteobacteria bacterium]|nr:hypothetical protein [Deltaproteobacteria bacterium]
MERCSEGGLGGRWKRRDRAFFYLGVKDTCEIGQLSGILQAYWGETKLAPVVCKGVPWTRNEKFSTYEKAAVQSGFFECVAEVRLPGGGTAPADAAVKKPVKVGGSLWATDGAGNSSGWTIPSNGGPIDADLSCSFAGGVASCERTNLAGDPLELCKKGLSKQVPKLAWSPHVVAIVVPHDKKTLVAMAKPKIKIDVKTISVAAPSIPGCSIGPKIEVEAVVRSDNGKPIKMFSTEAKNGNCVLTPKPAPPVGSAEMTLSCSGPAEAVVPVKKGTTFSYEILIRAKNAAGNVSQKVFKGTVKPSPAW